MRQLVIFAKDARIGRAKTRLAKSIGRVQAWAFYRWSLARVAGRVGSDPRWKTYLGVTPEKAVFNGRLWPIRSARITQGSGDLGARMGRMMAVLPPGPVVIIGTDLPDVAASDIWAAFAALGDHDAVLGPATDGGYWLVGLKRAPRIPNAFAGVRWSHDETLNDTLANLKGLKVALLDQRTDVDDGESYAAWKQAAP